MKTTHKQTILNYGPIKCLNSYKSQIHLKMTNAICASFSNKKKNTKPKPKFSQEIYNEQFAQH